MEMVVFLFKKCLDVYFHLFNLNVLYYQPNVDNKGPNKI